MPENLVLLGFIIIIIGFLVVLAGAFLSGGGKSKIAVGGFIGSIPFVFVNDPGIARFAVTISIIIFLAFIILNVLAKVSRIQT